MLSPWKVLNTARRRVPVVDFALGAAGVSAAAAIIIGFLGYSRATFIIFGAMILGMLLLMICARLMSARSKPIIMAGLMLIWAVALFFITFLVFTATAVAIKWPNVWASLLLGEPTPAFTAKPKICLPEDQKLASGSCGHPEGNYIVTNVPWGDAEGGLNVRERPDLSSVSIGTIPAHTTDLIVGNCKSGWCSVKCKNLQGWSKDRYLALRSSSLHAVTGVDKNSPHGLILRNGPDKICSAIESIPYDGRDIVLHSCQSGAIGAPAWCLVTYKGVSGWTPSRFLRHEQ